MIAGKAGFGVEEVKGREALQRFAALPYEIYASRDAWWPPDIQSEIDLLTEKSPAAKYLEIAPFWAVRKGHPLVRLIAVVNHRYNRHWNERLGQIIHFEALPDEEPAARATLEEACQWLKARGMTGARSGFAAFLDFPYSIDNYNELPSFLLRSTPPYYHSYFKNAGFVTEKGMVDYTIPLTDQNLQRYRKMLTSALRAETAVVSWREYGFRRAVSAWVETTNLAFEKHWGWNPITDEEAWPMLAALEGTPAAECSMLALHKGKAIGMVFSVPDFSPMLAQVRAGYRIPPERGGGKRGALINIGVVKEFRGQGVNLAMAARSFLTMAAQGELFAGYTLVLDDNWPSRRTAEKLGAMVTGNFVAYRRDFAA